jgi:hypothetical protein
VPASGSAWVSWPGSLHWVGFEDASSKPASGLKPLLAPPLVEPLAPLLDVDWPLVPLEPLPPEAPLEDAFPLVPELEPPST